MKDLPFGVGGGSQEDGVESTVVTQGKHPAGTVLYLCDVSRRESLAWKERGGRAAGNRIAKRPLARRKHFTHITLARLACDLRP